MFTRAPNTLTRVYAARMDSLTSQDHTPQMNIAQRRNWIPPPRVAEEGLPEVSVVEPRFLPALLE